MVLALSAPLTVFAGSSEQLRCGWFDNPSPGNAWLLDGDDDWTIATQSGHEATGEWPRFKAAQWVRAGNGSYGYGCACLRVEANVETSEVDRILSSRARPLAACRADPRVRDKEPKVR